MAGANGGEVFSESTIPDVVKTLDAPVTPTHGLKLCGVESFIGTTTKNDLHFLTNFAGLEMMGRTEDKRGLGGVGKAGLFRGDREGKNLSGFMPTMTLVQSDVRREKKRLSE